MDHLKRSRKLMEALNGSVDGVLILNFEGSDWANSVYFTGFTGSHSEILITHDDVCIITDGRYYDQVVQESEALFIKPDPHDKGFDTLKRVLDDRNVKKCGVVVGRVTARHYNMLKDMGLELESVDDAIGKLRMRKDEEELALIKEAVRIAESVFEEVLDFMRPGMTEREVAAYMEYRLKLRGDGPSFPVIVASGPNSALPHAKPTDKVMEKGDIVVLDFGARYRNYCSDITRTLSVGVPNPEAEEIAHIIMEAQDAVLRDFKLSMTGAQVDALARDVIASKGYGDAFKHSLGHGIGLEVHEAPRISWANENPIPSGSVITVEPGVYISGRFGVRIEEDVSVSQEGLTRLTNLERTIFVV